MEVLSINVIHEIWLFVEFMHIEIFDSNTNFSAFLNVESISDESQVWMGKSHNLRNNIFNLTSWSE